MAIRGGASGRKVVLTGGSGFPVYNGLTQACWIRINSHRASTYEYPIGIENAASSGGAGFLIGYSSALSNFGIWNESTNITTGFTSIPTVGDWYFMAQTCVGGANGHKGYKWTRDGTLETAQANYNNSAALSHIFFANDSWDEWNDCNIAHMRVWNTALTQSELFAEMWSPRALRRENLYCDIPGYKHDELHSLPTNPTITVGGTLSTESNPPLGTMLPTRTYFLGTGGNALVNSDLSPTYNVIGQVNSDLAVTYSIDGTLTQVNNDLSPTYSIIGAINSVMTDRGRAFGRGIGRGMR